MHHNFTIEAFEQKYKMISKQVYKTDYLLEDNSFNSEVKTLLWELHAAEIEVKLLKNWIYIPMKAAFDWEKWLAYMNRHSNDKSKKNWDNMGDWNARWILKGEVETHILYQWAWLRAWTRWSVFVIRKVIA